MIWFVNVLGFVFSIVIFVFIISFLFYISIVEICSAVSEIVYMHDFIKERKKGLI